MKATFAIADLIRYLGETDVYDFGQRLYQKWRAHQQTILQNLLVRRQQERNRELMTKARHFFAVWGLKSFIA